MDGDCIRGFIASASLKPRGARLHGCGRKRYPRLYRLGLIEATDRQMRIGGRVVRGIRGFIASASLKLLKRWPKIYG